MYSKKIVSFATSCLNKLFFVMKKTIFFSWASDFNGSISHKEMILNCLKIAAVKKGNKDLSVITPYVTEEEKHIVEYELNDDSQLIPQEFEIQNATSGESGSPSIEDTIFDRIARCSLYVCDVSIALSEKDIQFETKKNVVTAQLCDKGNGRKSPNPNVMLELGYAIHTLGWNKIVMFFDNLDYRVEDLPFDIRHHVPIFFDRKKIDTYLKPYHKDCHTFKELQEKYLQNTDLSAIINLLYKNFDSLDTLIENEMQFRIDSIFLSLLKTYSDVLYCLDSDFYGIDHLLNISQEELETLIKRAEGLRLGNISTLYINFCKDDNKTYQLDKIIDLLITSNIYKKSWIKVLIKLKYFIIQDQFLWNILHDVTNNLDCQNSLLKIIEITKKWLNESDRDIFSRLNYMSPNNNTYTLNFSNTNRKSYLWTYSYEEQYEETYEGDDDNDYWLQEAEDDFQARVQSADPSEFTDRYLFKNGEKIKIGQFLDSRKVK